MIYKLLFVAAAICIVACQSQPVTPVVSAPVTPPPVFPDTIFVDVDSTGTMRLGGKNLADTDVLKAALTDSLRAVAAHGGKVPAIWYHTHGDVLMGMRGELQDVFMEVKEGMK